GVLLQWQTGYEINNLGFNVYRDVAGQRTKLTPTLVAGSGLTAGKNTPVNSAHAYAWWDLDPAALSGSAVYYLEDVDFNATSTFHGPVSPVSGGDLAPMLPQSTVLTGLSQTNPTASSQFVTRGEPLARQWGPGEALKSGTRLDTHEPGPLAIGQAQLETQGAVAGRPGIRIGVRAPGWYRLAQPDLIAAGLDSRVDARNLQLFVDGVEQAIVVRGADGGRFGASAAIEFYGTGVDTPYTDTHV